MFYEEEEMLKDALALVLKKKVVFRQRSVISFPAGCEICLHTPVENLRAMKDVGL